MSEKIEASAEQALRVEGSIYEQMAPEIVGERGIAQVWNGPDAMRYAHMFAAAPRMLEALTALVSGDCVYYGDEIRIKCASHGDAMQRMRLGRKAVVAAGGAL